LKPSEILKIIKSGDIDESRGICDNFVRIMSGKTGCKIGDGLSPNALNNLINSNKIILDDWHLYSGFAPYPVPSFVESHSDLRAFVSFKKWSKHTKYGRARWEFLDWLIEQFENKGL